MARQVLGRKKHARCEQLAGQSYTACFVRGGGAHYWALCIWGDPQNADYVNYQTGQVQPHMRGGHLLPPTPLPTA